MARRKTPRPRVSTKYTWSSASARTRNAQLLREGERAAGEAEERPPAGRAPRGAPCAGPRAAGGAPALLGERGRPSSRRRAARRGRGRGGRTGGRREGARRPPRRAAPSRRAWRLELALDVARQLLDAEGRDLDAEVLGRHVLDEVRLVEDQGVVGGDHLAVAAVLHREVGAEQVVVHDHDVGLERPLAHAGHEAGVEERARLADAVLARGRDLAPEVHDVRHVRDLGAVAGLRSPGPRPRPRGRRGTSSSRRKLPAFAKDEKRRRHR